MHAFAPFSADAHIGNAGDRRVDQLPRDVVARYVLHQFFAEFERFSAAEALRIGFVHEVVAADALNAKVAELSTALVNAGPVAVKLCKKLVQDVAGNDITPELVNMTIASIADVRVSAEGREGVQAFLQKRKPNWLVPSTFNKE